jgi:hypothetical protein
MPDHVHLLFQPLRDKNGWPFPLVDILQCLRSATAHRINKILGCSGPVWEEESFDHDPAKPREKKIGATAGRLSLAMGEFRIEVVGVGVGRAPSPAKGRQPVSTQLFEKMPVQGNSGSRAKRQHQKLYSLHAVAGEGARATHSKTEKANHVSMISLY